MGEEGVGGPSGAVQVFEVGAQSRQRIRSPGGPVARGLRSSMWEDADSR